MIEPTDVHPTFIILYIIQESRIQVTEILFNLAEVNMGSYWFI